MKLIKISCALMLCSMVLFYSCKFKSKAAASIKGEGGDVVIEVDVLSGAEFKTKGRIPENACQGSQFGMPITVASCDVLADVTRRVKQPDGTFKEVTVRKEKHQLEYKIACVPGTEWEVDCSDPIIMQVPFDWQVAEATFSKTGFQGTLEVDETLPTTDFLGTPYLAEPGHKLIVLGFPYGTPEDTYQIKLRCTYSVPGRTQIKAIFAAAVRVSDPVTGQVRMFFPPAIPAVSDFALVQDPLFITEITGASVFARQMDEQEVALQALPQSATRTYLVLSTHGAAAAGVDLTELNLKKE